MHGTNGASVSRNMTTLGVLAAVGAAFVGIANLWLGAYLMRSNELGITGISPGRLRWLAWALSGADIRRNGTPRRWAMSGKASGSLHLLLGVAFIAVGAMILVV